MNLKIRNLILKIRNLNFTRARGLAGREGFLVNGAGATAKKGEGGRYYCGRRVMLVSGAG
jgi:hypothetical protein